MESNWWSEAECRKVPENEADAVFFPTLMEQEKMGAGLASSYCNVCPVRLECLKTALDGSYFGTWGGLTELDRLWLKRNVSGLHKLTASALGSLLDDELPECSMCHRHRRLYENDRCYHCTSATRKRKQIEEALDAANALLAGEAA
jgi:hypothetical protein